MKQVMEMKDILFEASKFSSEYVQDDASFILPKKSKRMLNARFNVARKSNHASPDRSIY